MRCRHLWKWHAGPMLATQCFPLSSSLESSAWMMPRRSKLGSPVSARPSSHVRGHSEIREWLLTSSTVHREVICAASISTIALSDPVKPSSPPGWRRSWPRMGPSRYTGKRGASGSCASRWTGPTWSPRTGCGTRRRHPWSNAYARICGGRHLRPSVALPLTGPPACTSSKLPDAGQTQGGNRATSSLLGGDEP